MKQLLITKNIGYADSYNQYDFTKLTEGSIAFFELGDNKLLTSTPKQNFGIVLGSADNVVPFVIPEVDICTLQGTKALPTPGTKFKAEITIPKPEFIGEFTILIAKKGKLFNERSNWHASTVVCDKDEAADVAKILADRINDLAIGSEEENTLAINATANGAVITIEGINIGEDFQVLGADGLRFAKIEIKQAGTPAIGDKAYIKQLYSMTKGNKGIQYIDAKEPYEMYANYPIHLEDDEYIVYTLRFKVGRDAAKTRDERVWQIVHIAVPTSSAAIGTLDTILGIESSTTVQDGNGGADDDI